MFNFRFIYLALTLATVGSVGAADQMTVPQAVIAPTNGNKVISSENTNSTSENNRQVVLDFYEKGLNQKNADAALRYIGSRYIQHNPNAGDGPEGFRQFIAFLREKFPNSHSEVKRIFVDGDYVILHVHAVRVPGTQGNAIVDIFKLEDGKIVEHWDVNQAIPEKSANNNSMF